MAFVVTKVFDKAGHGESETFAGKIIKCITDKSRVNDTNAPVVVLLFYNFGITNFIDVRCWLKKT